MAARTIFIGDVHGCADELEELLAKLELTADDLLVFLGDLVDKGPHSLRVLRIVRALLNKKCIAGNHEEKALRLKWQGKDGNEEWAKDAQPDDWAFIESLPLLLRFPDLGAIAVHGGFFPRFFNLYPEGVGEVPEKWHKGGGKKMDRLRRVLRVRHVAAADGDFLALGEEKPEDPHWSEVYDGREGFAFYGHDPLVGEIRRAKSACGLDTGCVFGGTLTAAVVQSSPLTPIFVSVQARKQYAQARGE